MSNEAAESDAVIRAKLATNLVFVSSIGVIILVLVVIGAATWAQYVNPSSTTLRDAAQLVFTSILPLLGTWVGTVLAFYYTKENFESASRATLEAVRSGSQRLESTRVADKMMPTSAIVTARIPAGKTIDDIQTQEVVNEFEKLGSNGQKISRLLFLDDSGACTAILHRSVWVEMLNSGLRKAPQLDPSTNNLGKFLELPYASPISQTFKQFITGTLAYVALDRAVADAKAAMESKPLCQDVIVTPTGKSNEPMRGWISNVDITRLSQA